MTMRYILLVLTFCCSAHAAQYRTVTDNAVVSANISMHETNRIVLEGDRVKRFIRATGEMSFEHDPETGDLYVTLSPDPSGVRKDDLLGLFVVGESGATYHLKLRPKDIPAEQIFLTNYEIGLSPVSGSATAPRHADIAAFVSRVIRAEPRGRLRKVKLSRWHKRQKKKVELDADDGTRANAVARLQEQWLEPRWEGRIYKIKASRRNKTPVVLRASNFRPADGVWIATKVLNPGDSTEVLIVKARKRKGKWDAK